MGAERSKSSCEHVAEEGVRFHAITENNRKSVAFHFRFRCSFGEREELGVTSFKGPRTGVFLLDI